MLHSVIGSMVSTNTVIVQMIVIFKDEDQNQFSTSLNQEDIERNDLHQYLPSSSENLYAHCDGHEDEGDVQGLCKELFRIAESDFDESLDEYDIEQVKILLNTRHQISGQPNREEVGLVDLF